MEKPKIFADNQIYHVFNRSIANFNIFGNSDNSTRFVQALGYYNNPFNSEKLSRFLEHEKNYYPNLLVLNQLNNVKFITWHIMPDHYHFMVKLLKGESFSKYVSDVENSFTKFLNLKIKRKGPLWESRFKAVRIRNNEQLLHTTRYIHLNAVSAGLVDKPEGWPFSSYREIITNPTLLKNTLTEISISDVGLYKKFVEDRIDYQRKLQKIKKLLIDGK